MVDILGRITPLHADVFSGWTTSEEDRPLKVTFAMINQKLLVGKWMRLTNITDIILILKENVNFTSSQFLDVPRGGSVAAF